MTASASPIPVSVDYTSRDYYALRADLIKRVQDRVNTNLNKQWNGTDENDFGVALIEAMAYMGDIINYYVDRVANESSITTATQRESLLNLANLYGYTPSSYQAASTTLTFTNSTGSAVTIPTGTELYTSIAYNDTIQKPIFNTLGSVTIPAASGGTSGTASVTASHGEIVSIKNSNQYGELVGTSTGLANQSFPLTYNQVVQGSVKVYVQRGSSYDTWTEVTDVTPYGPTDTIYYLTTDADNIVSVNFSDGVSGAIPTNGVSIYVDYTIGGGVVGNLPANQTFAFYALPLGASITLPISGVTVVNSTAAQGGVDPESSDSIRTTAPAAINSLNRAVSTLDYQNLALGYSNVGKALVMTGNTYQINLAVAPYRDVQTSEIYPGYDSTGTVATTEMTTLASNVQTYLSSRAIAGTTISVFGPIWRDVAITVKFTPLAQFSVATVRDNIKQAILDIFDYPYVGFQDNIYPEEIEGQLRNVVGVNTVQVFDLRGNSSGNTTYPSGTNSRGVLSPTDNRQLFRFSLNCTKVIPFASLSALVVKNSSGTVLPLTPSFSPDVFDYAVAGGSTATVTVTPTTPLSYYAGQGTNTVGADTMTVTTAQTPITSGSTSSAITTPSASTTVIPVVVTTVDGLTKNTYNIRVTRP